MKVGIDLMFKDLLKNDSTILFDGGFGSELIKRGLTLGKVPDIVNIENPETITEIHKSYYDAGSDMCQTNTFGSTPLNPERYKNKRNEIWGEMALWLTDDSLPADIWMEAIPYKETRGYVAAVLTYAMIYQQQIAEKKTRISDFLMDVSSAGLRTKLASSSDK